jgi:hypothetical protein
MSLVQSLVTGSLSSHALFEILPKPVFHELMTKGTQINRDDEAVDKGTHGQTGLAPFPPHSI